MKEHSALQPVPSAPSSRLEALERESQSRRARIESTLSAMGKQIEAKKTQMSAYVERLDDLKDHAIRYRWPLIGAAVVAGYLVGRRPRPKTQVYLLPAETATARAERLRAVPTRRPRSLFRTVLTTVATHLARRAVEHVLDAQSRR